MKNLKYFMAIFLVTVLLSIFSACLAKPVQDEADVESQPEQSEPAPVRPTAAEAAKHNEAIDPAKIRMIQFEEPEPGDMLAVILTTAGDITVRLFKAQAPETVGTFIKLAEEGHYNNGKFSESVEGYKIDGAGKSGEIVFPGEEFSLDLWNVHGAVAVSNNGSNFMIVTANYPLNSKSELEELKFPGPVLQKYLSVGGVPHQDWKNTVFGQVIEGMDVAEKISSADGEPVEIIEIEINEY